MLRWIMVIMTAFITITSKSTDIDDDNDHFVQFTQNALNKVEIKMWSLKEKVEYLKQENERQRRELQDLIDFEPFDETELHTDKELVLRRRTASLFGGAANMIGGAAASVAQGALGLVKSIVPLEWIMNLFRPIYAFFSEAFIKLFREMDFFDGIFSFLAEPVMDALEPILGQAEGKGEEAIKTALGREDETLDTTYDGIDGEQKKLDDMNVAERNVLQRAMDAVRSLVGKFWTKIETAIKEGLNDVGAPSQIKDFVDENAFGLFTDAIDKIQEILEHLKTSVSKTMSYSLYNCFCCRSLIGLFACVMMVGGYVCDLEVADALEWTLEHNEECMNSDHSWFGFEMSTHWTYGLTIVSYIGIAVAVLNFIFILIGDAIGLWISIALATCGWIPLCIAGGVLSAVLSSTYQFNYLENDECKIKETVFDLTYGINIASWVLGISSRLCFCFAFVIMAIDLKGTSQNSDV